MDKALYRYEGCKRDCAFDRQQVRTLFQKIEVFRDGMIKVPFAHEEWKKYIETALAEISKKD